MFLTNHEIALKKRFAGITMSAFIHTFSSNSEAIIRTPKTDLEFMSKKLAEETETNQEARITMLEN